jgi:hypothetical protein
MLRQGQSVAVSGPRRIGKTSLLFQLAHPAVAGAHGLPPDTTAWAYLDGGALDGLDETWLYGAADRALGGSEDALVLLLQHPGQVLTPEALEAALWPGEATLDPERVRGVMKKLRAALGPAGAAIVNRRGQGYIPIVSATAAVDPQSARNRPASPLQLCVARRYD